MQQAQYDVKLQPMDVYAPNRFWALRRVLSMSSQNRLVRIIQCIVPHFLLAPLLKHLRVEAHCVLLAYEKSCDALRHSGVRIRHYATTKPLDGDHCAGTSIDAKVNRQPLT
jgi:hypothetical protein